MVLLDILPLKTPKNEKTQPGIYIMQNTMVRGGGEKMASWGKKLK